jgi:hypothetical protein
LSSILTQICRDHLWEIEYMKHYSRE